MESYTSYSSFTLLVITLVSIGFIKLLSVLYRQHVYWKNKGVPSLSSAPLLGTGWRMFLQRITITDYAKFLYNSNPNFPYIGMMDMATPALVIRDPELIKDITVKNFEHFMDHRFFVDETVDPVFGKNVFSLRGERWREMRNTLSPSFTASKMRFLFDLVNKCSRGFVDHLERHPEFASSIETKDALTRYTTDVIATAAFGIGINSLEDGQNEFFVRGTEAAKFGGLWQIVKLMVLRGAPTVAKFLGFSVVSHSSAKFFRRIISETLRVREEKGIVRPDMIHLLMQARDKDSSATPMTTDDIVAQAFIFFLGGFDTTSTLMCYVIHELAMNPDIQEKLRKEVELHMEEGNKEITYEALSKMEYMDMVISETLRKYPPAIFIDRVCVKQFELPPAIPGSKPPIVEPGTTIWFPIFAMHRDPKYFPEPEKFDPERFSEENKDNIIPYTYIPFGTGPRKCIGNRFALMGTKILIAHLLRSFNVKPTEKTRHPVVFKKMSFVLNAEGGLWVGLEKRET